jgi:hypothetical protein
MVMKQYLKNLYYSLPLQLVLLHFRKYQVLLLFWYILFGVCAGSFMKTFGAEGLFFSPEYLGKVNFVGAFIMGTCLAVFVMSWNITTFILQSKRIKFLATTTQPFLKYCINNAIIPICFLVFYIFKSIIFNTNKELMQWPAAVLVTLAVFVGFWLIMLISFAYFFTADKNIEKRLGTAAIDLSKTNELENSKNDEDSFGLKVWWYLSKSLKVRAVRNVKHYKKDFIDAVFRKHHLAAIFCILAALLFLVIIGFFLENKYAEIPASASILLVLSLAMALLGALTYFLQSWSLIAVIVSVFILNKLYQSGVIDPHNKAYGINYTQKNLRPIYNDSSLNTLCSDSIMAQDKLNMLTILNNWKRKQTTEKPLMVFINVSGGGLRSAGFTMNALQNLAKNTNGKLMENCFMINGASGGMLAAAYYRQLYLQNKKITNNPNSLQHTYSITNDLLNPVFTSLLARDLFGTVQKFNEGNNFYIKDRGYAFERKMISNTNGLLNVQLKELKAPEYNAEIPLMIFNSVVRADARKMLISTQPISFLMKPYATAIPDAVDFTALFKNQQALNLKLTTAMRMNATFPYILPNVWLPSNPVIDVMDAGLRDNFGQETTLRFISNFKDWIENNTSGVLIIQIRDREINGVNEKEGFSSLTDMMFTPATMTQKNLFKLQHYYQEQQYNYLFANDSGFYKKVTLQYQATNKQRGAPLSFHLTALEKQDVIQAYYNPQNQKVVELIKSAFLKSK